MKGSNSAILAVIAVVLLIVAAVLIYRNVTAGAGASETVILPGDPKQTDPTFDPNRNRPPELGEVGGPAQGN